MFVLSVYAVEGLILIYQFYSQMLMIYSSPIGKTEHSSYFSQNSISYFHVAFMLSTTLCLDCILDFLLLPNLLKLPLNKKYFYS